MAPRAHEVLNISDYWNCTFRGLVVQCGDFIPCLHRSGLTNQMSSRSGDLDVKLLLYAIQKTTSFEKTLAQRFFQSPYMEEVRETERERGEGGMREGGMNERERDVVC